MRPQWLGHPQHFIGAWRCYFRMATVVGDYVVSTVGECIGEDDGIVPIGFDRTYETLVFRHTGQFRPQCGCPIIEEYDEIDSSGYNDAKSAQEGHMRMVSKYLEVQ